MTARSEPELLVLHAVRLLGFADTTAVAARARVGRNAAGDLLREAERRRWVQHLSFADLGGWSLTEAGRIENERRLAVERESRDPDDRIAAVHRSFLPLNARLLRAITDWQLSPTAADPFAPNDHTDWDRDGPILAQLTELHAALTPLVEELTGVLARFDGYADRFESALAKAKSGHHEWVDRTDVDSCHRIWFQLHEDLLATLGIERGAETTSGLE